MFLLPPAAEAHSHLATLSLITLLRFYSRLLPLSEIICENVTSVREGLYLFMTYF